MVISLSNLRSTNKDGAKHIHVTVKVSNEPTEATLDFLICGKNSSETYSFAANETREVSHAHNESGMCWVRVTDRATGISTQKLLNLDAEESY